MKLDKVGKTWAKIAGVVFMTCSAYLLGGLHSPWASGASIEGKIWTTVMFLVVTMGFMALAFFTELEE